MEENILNVLFLMLECLRPNRVFDAKRASVSAAIGVFRSANHGNGVDRPLRKMGFRLQVHRKSADVCQNRISDVSSATEKR